MKSAEEWWNDTSCDSSVHPIEVYRAIQRDALEAAAKVCDQVADPMARMLGDRIRKLRAQGGGGVGGE